MNDRELEQLLLDHEPALQEHHPDLVDHVLASWDEEALPVSLAPRTKQRRASPAVLAAAALLLGFFLLARDTSDSEARTPESRSVVLRLEKRLERVEWTILEARLEALAAQYETRFVTDPRPRDDTPLVETSPTPQDRITRLASKTLARDIAAEESVGLLRLALAEMRQGGVERFEDLLTGHGDGALAFLVKKRIDEGPR